MPSVRPSARTWRNAADVLCRAPRKLGGQVEEVNTVLDQDPPRAGLVPEPMVGRHDIHDRVVADRERPKRTEQALAANRLHRLHQRVMTEDVVDRDHQTCACCRIDHTPGVLHRQRQGFLHDDVLARLQGFHRQSRMRGGLRGDRNDSHIRVFEERCGVGVGPGRELGRLDPSPIAQRRDLFTPGQVEKSPEPTVAHNPDAQPNQLPSELPRDCRILWHIGQTSGVMRTRCPQAEERSPDGASR
jgi:hypothetical protein